MDVSTAQYIHDEDEENDFRRKPHMFNTLNVRGQGLLTGQGYINTMMVKVVMVTLLVMMFMNVKGILLRRIKTLRLSLYFEYFSYFNPT